MRAGLLSLFIAAACLAACGEDDTKLYNVFEPPPPVAEVPCAMTSPWTVETPPVDEGLGHIWGMSANSIWAVGGNGTILHYDGTAWKNVSPSIGVDLLSVHGIAEDDIWAVGRSGVAAHWDGTLWTEVPSGTTKVIVGVWVVAHDDVWMIGDDGVRRFDGTRIKAEPGWPAGALNGIWASGADDVRIVGDVETYRFDGRAFETQPIANSGTLAAVWGTDEEHAWTIGHNSMSRPGFGELQSGKWLFSAAPPRAVYFSLWTLSPDELWAGANDTTIFYRSGGQWCREYIEGLGAVNAFWGATRDDVWAVGAKRDAAGASKPVLLRRKTR